MVESVVGARALCVVTHMPSRMSCTSPSNVRKHTAYLGSHLSTLCALKIGTCMCTAVKEAPPATLATFLNELWCHRTKVLSRRLRRFYLIARMDRRKLRAPDLRIGCFESQVRSVLSFGFEVWGPTVLARVGDRVEHPPRAETRSNMAYGWFQACLQDPAVRLQIQYMRHLAGVARPAHRVLLAEFGQHPLQAFWARVLLVVGIALYGSRVHSFIVLFVSRFCCMSLAVGGIVGWVKSSNFWSVWVTMYGMGQCSFLVGPIDGSFSFDWDGGPLR